MKRPINKQNLIVSVGLGFGAVFIWLGANSAVTGRDAMRIPAVIEEMSPGPGDEVLQQSQVSVDFIDGYEARLSIDGIALDTTRLDELSATASANPGSQVDLPPTAIWDPGNFIISYTPQQGAPIESFSQGTHKVTVTFWKLVDGEQKSRSFSWEFSAN